jgi:hypothetical protein
MNRNFCGMAKSSDRSRRIGGNGSIRGIEAGRDEPFPREHDRRRVFGPAGDHDPHAAGEQEFVEQVDRLSGPHMEVEP